MNNSELKMEVLGRCSAVIPDPAIRFALEFYDQLDKQSYHATDVADCIALARKVLSLSQIAGAEISLIAQLEKFKGLVEEAGQFKTSLAKIAKAIKPAKKRAKRTKKAKARPDPAHARQPDARRGEDTQG